jgi:hypothetical protein
MSRPRWLLLLLLSAVPAAGEAVVLRAAGFASALSLAPQITAISPYGSFHDLRWIAVYHDSWPALIGELVAAVVARSLFTVAMTVVASGPAGGSSAGAAAGAAGPVVGRPPIRVLARGALVFHALAVLMLAPWTVIAVAAAQTSLSWFLPAEVLPLLLLGLVLTRGGTAQQWWRGAPTKRLVGLGLLGFALLPVASLAVQSAPGWWVVPVAAVAGAANGWLWRQVVTSPAPDPHRLVGRAPVPVLVAGALILAMLSAGQLAGLGRQNAREPLPAITGPGVAAVHQPVIFVGGYDTDWDGSPIRVGLRMQMFSYRGLAGDGHPLPYQPVDTYASLDHSADLLARQVSAASRRAGRPVSLVAQSEGTFVVRRYLAGTPHPPVDAVVLMSPLVQASRVYFPPRQAGSGWGIGTGWLLRGMLSVAGATGGPAISPDQPFERSLLDDALLYRDRMLCPVAGVRIVAFVPLADAIVVPPDRYAHIPVVGLVDVHAGMLPRPEVQRALLAFLAGGQVDSGPGRWFPVVQKSASGWQVPALALRVNPAWHAEGQPDASFDGNGCATTGRPG